jgi:hypothetical protein
MPINELLQALAALRVADLRLEGAPPRSPQRAAAMREIHRLERIAFAGALRPEPTDTRRPPIAAMTP